MSLLVTSFVDIDCRTIAFLAFKILFKLSCNALCEDLTETKPTLDVTMVNANFELEDVGGKLKYL